jgi:DNA polymerase I-like protein with 3'-5' exonuclease and polymerase domains
MIYLISKNKSIIDSSIQYNTVEESLIFLQALDWISVDIETTGLDRHINKILLIQLGNKDIQYVIDVTTIDILLYKSILENKNLILQNAKFDIQFLYKLNIIPQGKIWDTMLAEQVLYNGLDPMANLYYLADKYCNIQLNKTTRNNFTSSNYKLDVSSIIYAAEDTEVLGEIKQKQEYAAKKKDILKAIHLENSFVKALAYIEFCGMYVNTGKWLDKFNKLLPLIRQKKLDLDDIIIKDERLSKFIELQLDLFSSKTTVNISYNSSKQMIPVFLALGLDISDMDAKSGMSIAEKNISKYKYSTPFVKTYLEYKALVKSSTTYGEKFLSNIHTVTGRLHSEYTQLQITGRISSSAPNLNNIPRDKITRACFEAEKGNVLIDLDYSDQEGRIIANVSGEPNLIDMYNAGKIDGHSYVAKLCFKEELKDIEISEIKSKFPDLRQKAKSARFAITFGGNGTTIANNLGVEKKIGVKVYKAYIKAFPALFTYFDAVKAQTKKNGYILISPLTGRKVFHRNFFDLEENDYEHYDFLKKSLNYPIQGRAAEMIKIASILLFKWIVENNYFNIVKIIGNVYDELVIEAPEDISEFVAKEAQECMTTAANYFATLVPITADYDISKHWVH